MIVNDKNKLLKPIISRFCYIYIPYLNVDNKNINYLEIYKKRYLTQLLYKLKKQKTMDQIVNTGKLLYKNAYSCIDLIHCIDNYKLTILFDMLRIEIRNEELLVIIFLYFYIFRHDINLENIAIR